MITLALVVCLLSISSATVTFTAPDNRTVSLESVPLSYQGNNPLFATLQAPIRVFSRSITLSDQGRCILLIKMLDTEDNDSSTVGRLSVLQVVRNLPANILAVIYGHRKDNVEGKLLGNIGSFHTDFNTLTVTVPIVEIGTNATNTLLASIEASGNALTVNLTSEGTNAWTQWKSSGLDIACGVILMVWEAVNIGLAVWVLSGWKFFRKNIAVLCLWLDIIASASRVVWAVALLKARTVPYELKTVFFTNNIPASLAATILLSFYWHEIVSSTALEIFAKLNKSKWPAVASVIVVCLLEVVSSCLRAVGFEVVALYTATIAVYIVFMALLMGYYWYVAAKVLLFVRQLARQRFRDGVMLKVTMRVLFSSIGMLVIIISAILFASPAASFPQGSLVSIFTHLGFNLMSTAQILAFERPVKPKSAVTSFPGATSRGGLSQSPSARSLADLSSHS